MEEPINIAICDDEILQVELLKKYVFNWAEKNNYRINIEPFYNAESFEFNWSMNKGHDILLLDIQMPGISGIDLAKKIREKDKHLNIIFITAISDYIGQGYDLYAINYLLKPIKEQKLYECLDRSVDKIPREEKTILLSVDGDIIRLKQSDIIYIEAFSHHVEINTEKDRYKVRKNISVIENELDSYHFVRSHRSYIVGLRHIKKISKDSIELDSNDIVPISRRQFANTNKAFIQYFKGEIND